MHPRDKVPAFQCVLVTMSCVSMHPGYKSLHFNASWLQVPAFQCILVASLCVSMHPGDKVPAFQCIMETRSLRFNASW